MCVFSQLPIVIVFGDPNLSGDIQTNSTALSQSSLMDWSVGQWVRAPKPSPPASASKGASADPNIVAKEREKIILLVLKFK